jgi:hypothetical protein
MTQKRSSPGVASRQTDTLISHVSCDLHLGPTDDPRVIDRCWTLLWMATWRTRQTLWSNWRFLTSTGSQMRRWAPNSLLRTALHHCVAQCSACPAAAQSLADVAMQRHCVRGEARVFGTFPAVLNADSPPALDDRRRRCGTGRPRGRCRRSRRACRSCCATSRPPGSCTRWADSLHPPACPQSNFCTTSASADHSAAQFLLLSTQHTSISP